MAVTAAMLVAMAAPAFALRPPPNPHANVFTQPGGEDEEGREGGVRTYKAERAGDRDVPPPGRHTLPELDRGTPGWQCNQLIIQGSGPDKEYC